MALKDAISIGKGISGCLLTLVVYGLLLAWAISGEYLGLGLLALGVIMETRVHQQEERLIELRATVHELRELIEERLPDVSSRP